MFPKLLLRRSQLFDGFSNPVIMSLISLEWFYSFIFPSENGNADLVITKQSTQRERSGDGFYGEEWN